MNKIFIFIILVLSSYSAENLKFSGLGYFEYSYSNEKNITASNSFEFNRIYFTFEKKMSDKLSYKFQTDVGRKSDDGRLEVYIKNAKVDYKTDFGKFVIGLQGMNLFSIQEKTWGYRSIEKSAMDKNKFASSAAMGLGYYNAFNDLYFSVLVTNGAGYKKPEDDPFKKLSANINYGPSKLNSKDGINIGGSFTFEPYDNDSETESVFVTSVYAGYAKSKIRVGAEWDQLINSIENDPTQILSLYSNIAIHNKVHLYGKIDLLTNTDYRNDYVIIGLAYSPEKGLRVMPNIRYIKETGTDDIINYNLNFEFNIN